MHLVCISAFLVFQIVKILQSGTPVTTYLFWLTLYKEFKWYFLFV